VSLRKESKGNNGKEGERRRKKRKEKRRKNNKGEKDRVSPLISLNFTLISDFSIFPSLSLSPSPTIVSFRRLGLK
jgi:hypothetical protein